MSGDWRNDAISHAEIASFSVADNVLKVTHVTLQ